MRELLWMPDLGMFAEGKDWLGLQRVRPSAAVWSFYHTMDAGIVTPKETSEMTRYIDRQIPHLPVRGPGVPDGLHTLATTNWMPYSWSINNVTMNENAHTALAYWQAGRPDAAFRILKGSLLAAMFMGISPGNVGSMSYLDVYRRESPRDFADGSGVLSRAIVEGLFGVRPDALTGELLIAPGFPSDWDHARLRHPQVDLTYTRKELSETFTAKSRFNRPMNLRLQIPTAGAQAKVTVNGQVVEAKLLSGLQPRLEIVAAPAAKYEISATWSGVRPGGTRPPDGLAWRTS